MSDLSAIALATTDTLSLLLGADIVHTNSKTNLILPAGTRRKTRDQGRGVFLNIRLRLANHSTNLDRPGQLLLKQHGIKRRIVDKQDLLLWGGAGAAENGLDFGL